MRTSLLVTLLVLLALGTTFAQDTNFTNGPQYLPTGSSLFSHPITTPSLSLEPSSLNAGASNATGVLSAGAADENVLPPSAAALPDVNFFPIYYYGAHEAGNVEISFAPETPAQPIPPSILNTGVQQFTTAQGLAQRGYGVTLVEAAASNKTHQRAVRLYTNADIERLRGGS